MKIENGTERKWLVPRALDMKEKFKFMYEQSALHDVEFVVNGTKIGAHRLVLSVSSPVFTAMFQDIASDGKSVVEIVDFKSFSAFEEFIKFIYVEEADITMENVFPMMYLSKHYEVPALEEICSSFVLERVCRENASDILDFALKLEKPDIEAACKQILARHCNDMINNGSFSKISHETLRYFLEQNSLPVSETELALAVLKWCQEEVTRKVHTPDSDKEDGKKADRRTIRSVIGDSLYLVRFPCMDEGVFAAKIAYSNLLSLKEVRDVFSYFCYKRMLKATKDDDLTAKLQQLISKIPFPIDSRISVLE